MTATAPAGAFALGPTLTRDYARERIARANRVDAAQHGRPTAHCLDCGALECECRPVDLDVCPGCQGSGERAVGFDWRDPAAGYTTECGECSGTGERAA